MALLVQRQDCVNRVVASGAASTESDGIKLRIQGAQLRLRTLQSGVLLGCLRGEELKTNGYHCVTRVIKGTVKKAAA